MYLFEKESPMIATVSVFQMDIALGDKKANMAAVRARLEKACTAAPKPDIIVLPELWSTGYVLEKAPQLASEGGQEEAAFLGSLAREFGVAFVGGSVLAKEGNAFRNRAQVIEANGAYTQHYDKIHLIALMNEDTFLQRGNRRLLFTLNGVRIGVIICYDLRFCELPRILALEGADMLVVSAEWPTARGYAWEALLQARAAENQMYVVGCNRCGKAGNEEFAGSSMIVGPDGKIITRADKEEAILTAAVDTEEPGKLRKSMPLFGDRVPDLYI